MNAAQKAALLKLIEEHAGAQTDPIARDRLARAKDALDGCQVCVDGRHRAKARATTTAYRGQSFLIEFDNTQNNANHIHQVWRDFKGDWGRDLLAEHYKSAPH